MTIDAIEDGSEVRQPDRRIGKIRVTRRERKLISDGKDINVKVCGSDGLCRRFLFSQLEEIHYKEPEVGMNLERANNGERMIGYRFSTESLKEIQNGMDDYNIDIDEIDELLVYLDNNGLLKIG